MTKLTNRQREILELLETGIDVPTIAEKLKLSIKTVDAHLYNGAYKILDVNNKQDALKKFKKLKVKLDN